MRAWALISVFAAMMGTASADAVRVDGGMVTVPDASADGVRAFKGLPYAAPPVGDRRWRAPAPVAAWKGTRSAEQYGPNCLQPKLYNDIDPFAPSMSEDCLYLNVWTAARAGDSRPVIVWIHGGGYRAGYGGEPRHDGTVLAKKGVVVVSINYRLGVFGFLAHPDLTAESAQHTSGNYAYMDMIAALNWVKRNIATFGGDPKRVTIAGESAGSDAVSRLMASPQTAGLFHRAIGESGAAFGTMPDDTLAVAEAKGVAFTKAMDGKGIAALRQRSSAEILALVLAPDAKWGFGPVIDGAFLPATPREIFAAGKQNDVPLLTGWNADEGILFEGILGDKTLSDVLAQRFGAAAGTAASFYTSADARARLAGDMIMNFPTWSWAVAQTKTGRAPVYLYRFDQVPPIPANWFGKEWLGKYTGAFHSGEIPYVFGQPGIMPGWTPTPDDLRLADTMSSAWAAFAAGGDPNGAGLPHWTAYQPGGQRMIFGPATGEQADSDAARLKFWMEH
jgi:para-nitrobenzyl esterase